jgi:hypothetical protein
VPTTSAALASRHSVLLVSTESPVSSVAFPVWPLEVHGLYQKEGDPQAPENKRSASRGIGFGFHS